MNEFRELNQMDAADGEKSLFSLVPVGDGSESVLQFSLGSGADVGWKCFAVNLRICQNPTCKCGYIGMECSPVTDDGVASSRASVEAVPLRVDLDVFDRAVKSPSNARPAADALALAVAAEIQDADWGWLMGYLQWEKRELMKSMNLATLDVSFPPEVIEDGAMVGYREVFPWAEIWTFDSGGDHWFVVDQYCVQPGCNCTDVAMTFVQPRDDTAASAETSPMQELCMFFNYKTGRLRMETEKPGYSADRLISVLRKTFPSLCQDLAQRHRQLQKLARPVIVKSRRNSKRSILRLLGKDPREDRQDPSQTDARRNAAVVGRNDLCPCGSGKKYKKCCMAADELSNSETGA